MYRSSNVKKKEIEAVKIKSQRQSLQKSNLSTPMISSTPWQPCGSIDPFRPHFPERSNQRGLLLRA